MLLLLKQLLYFFLKYYLAFLLISASNQAFFSKHKSEVFLLLAGSAEKHIRITGHIKISTESLFTEMSKSP